MSDPHISVDDAFAIYDWATQNTAAIAESLPECGRIISIARETQFAAKRQGPGLKGLWQSVKLNKGSNIGMHRAMRFIALLEHLKKAPWANTRFKPNDEMLDRLTATHLLVIVGPEAYKREKEVILTMLDSTANNEMHNTSNILWITSRQNGKTTTLGLFAAALVCLGQSGGELLNVYSTNLDRAMQVVKAAKQYMYWLKDNTLTGVLPTIMADNTRMLVIRTPDGVVNEMKARPRDANGCRGDAPAAAFLDEFGFMSLDMWIKFALPLLGKVGRCFTLTTTPPPAGPFASFIKSIKTKNEERNDFYFRHVNHSLVCDDCFELQIETDCVHQLGNIPPWKSVMTIHKTASVAPEHQRDIVLQELFGASRAVDLSYIKPHLIDRFVANRTAIDTAPDAIYVAIDPASHESSHMGLAAIVCARADISLVGTASVSAKRCEVVEVQAIVSAFVERVRAASTTKRTVHSIPFAFIVECNGSSVYAASILRTCRQAAFPNPVMNPFTSDNFSAEVTPNIGPWTTHANKYAMVEEVLIALLDRRLTVNPGCVTVGHEVINSKINPTPVNDALVVLGRELKRVSDDGKTISGKAGGLDDDAAMALFLGVYWSKIIKLKSSSKPIDLYAPRG